jgi:hypothetical protein
MRRPAPASDPDGMANNALTVIRGFLNEARAADVLDDDTWHRLLDELDRRAEVASRRGVAAPPRVPRQAPPLALRWQRVSADVAVHGLAYLGVLLLLAAALGFVLFAFGGVQPLLRPLAELAIPAVLFVGARLVGRRGARFVSTGVELAAGAMLPVVALAVWADGAPVPPDLAGGPLVVAWTASAGVLAAGLACFARRAPASPLRYLVAPTAWLAVGTAALVLPGGPSPAQPAAVALAIAATVALAGGSSLVRMPAAAAAGVVFLLSLAAAAATGWPPVPALAAGVGTLVTLALFTRGATATADLTWRAELTVVLLTAAAVTPGWGTGWAGALAALGAVVIAETAVGGPCRGRRSLVIAVPLALGLLVAVPDVPALSLSAGFVAAWAHARMLLTGDTREASGILVCAAAVIAPPLALWALAGVAGATAGLLGAALVLAALAAAALTLELCHGVYRWSLPVAAGLLPLTAVGVDTVPALAAAAAAATAGVVLLVWPAPALPARVWLAALSFTTATAYALTAAQASSDTRRTIAALGGLALVAAGAALTARTRGDARAASRQVALVGHVVTLSVLLAGAAPVASTAAAAWAGGWLLTALVRAVGSPAVLLPLAGLHLLAVATPVLDAAAGRLAWAFVVVLAAGATLAFRSPAWARLLAVLLLVAALAAGGPWPVAYFTALAGALQGLAVRAAARTRLALLAAAPLAGAAAWLAAVAWRQPTPEVQLVTAALVGGVTVAALGAAVRARVVRATTGAGWGLLALTFVVGAFAAAFVQSPLTAQAVAAAALLAAAGLAAAAAPSHWRPLRDGSGALTIVALLAARPAFDLAATHTVLLLLGAALACTLGALWGGCVVAHAPWAAPLQRTAAAQTLSALAIAGLSGQPRLIEAALLVGAVQCAAVGLGSRRAAVLAAAPPLASLAWLSFVLDGGAAAMLAVTVPVGLALLAEVEIGRWATRWSLLPDEGGASLRGLEWAAVVTLAGPPLLRLLDGAVWHVALAVGVGAGLLVWGAATHVRRRVYTGAATVAAAVVLTVTVPLVANLDLQGGYVWTVLAVAGVVLLGAASSVEHGRRTARGALRRVDQLMAGWE